MRLRRTRGTRRARPRRRMPRKIRRQRRGRSAFTSIKVSYSTYLTMSSVGGGLAAYATSNIHIQNIMSNLITSTPNVTNFIAAYEFVALVCPGFIHEHRHCQLQQLNGQFHVPGNSGCHVLRPLQQRCWVRRLSSLDLIQVARGRFCLAAAALSSTCLPALSARTSACRTGSQLPLALPTTMSRQGQVSSRSSLWVSTQLTGSQIRVTARPDYSGSRAHSSSKT